MSSVCLDLESTLSRLDPESAAMLERLVRDSLALAEQRRNSILHGNSRGWPEGYFEQTAGSFAGESLEPPVDPPAELLPRW